MTDFMYQLAVEGREALHARPIKPHNVDPMHVLAGLTKPGEEQWALRMLLGHYEWSMSQLKFKVGDKVRVKKRYLYLGDQNNGWHGYSPMFSDSIGIVTAIDWGVTQEQWIIVVRYDHPYRYVDYTGEFYVSDHAKSFYFYTDNLRLQRRKRDKSRRPC